MPKYEEYLALAKQHGLTAFTALQDTAFRNERTRDNVNCRFEREAIQSSGARYLYLLPAGAPDLPDDRDFGLALNQNSIQSIVQEVERFLGRQQ